MPKRGENIYKRKDGRWEGRYIKERKDNGKAIYGYIYSKSYREAKMKLLEKNQEIALKPDDRCFRHYADIWLQNKERSIKQSSYSKYLNLLNNHILPFFSNAKVKDITSNMIDSFIKTKIDIGNICVKTSGLSIRYIKDMVSVVCSIVNLSDENKKFSYCFDKWTTNKVSEVEILSRSEQMHLTSHLLKFTSNINLGILVSLYTGIRIGELCALKFSDISIADEMIFIDRTMQRIQTHNDSQSKTAIVITTPKTQKAIREIPIPYFLCEELKRITPENKNSFLLSGVEERYIEPRTIQYRFKSILKSCNLKDIKFHALRHTFATRCIEGGCDIKCLSEMLGHSSVSTTLNRYVHSSIEQKKSNITKMLSILNFKPSLI